MMCSICSTVFIINLVWIIIKVVKLIFNLDFVALTVPYWNFNIFNNVIKFFYQKIVKPVISPIS